MNEFLTENSESNEESDDSWLITFADLCTLLMVFFILLFSLSTIEEIKFTKAFGSLQEALGGKERGTPDSKQEEAHGALHELVKVRKELIKSQTQAFNDIRSFLVKSGVEGQVGAVLEEGTITLRLPAQLLFQPNSAEIDPKLEHVLQLIVDVFVRRREQRIDIRGYTDDTPLPANSPYKDSWELSAMRAINVLRYLLSKGIEAKRLTATGYGLLNPLVPNTTEENRARNRRVEFTLQQDVFKE